MALLILICSFLVIGPFAKIAISAPTKQDTNYLYSIIQESCHNVTGSNVLMNQKEIFDNCKDYTETSPNKECLLYSNRLKAYCETKPETFKYPTPAEISKEFNLETFCENTANSTGIGKHICTYSCINVTSDSIKSECYFAHYYNDLLQNKTATVQKVKTPSTSNNLPQPAESPMDPKNLEPDVPLNSKLTIQNGNSIVVPASHEDNKKSPKIVPDSHEDNKKSLKLTGLMEAESVPVPVNKTILSVTPQLQLPADNPDNAPNQAAPIVPKPDASSAEVLKDKPAHSGTDSINHDASSSNKKTPIPKNTADTEKVAKEIKTQPNLIVEQPNKPPISPKQDETVPKLDTVETDIDDGEGQHGIPDTDEYNAIGEADNQAEENILQPQPVKKVDHKILEKKPNTLQENPISNDSIDEIDGESYFMSYFMVICILVIVGYIGYHNRIKVMALLVEGKRSKRQYRGRRPNSANYHKLDSNLEEAISSTVTKNSNNVIY